MKTSTKLSIILAVVYILLPSVSFFLMKSKANAARTELSSIVHQLTNKSAVKIHKKYDSTTIQNIHDTINCVKIDGRAITPGSIYIVPSSNNDNTIHLNCEASFMMIKKDSLLITIDDPDRIYHGKIELKGLQTAIINSDTIRFKK